MSGSAARGTGGRRGQKGFQPLRLRRFAPGGLQILAVQAARDQDGVDPGGAGAGQIGRQIVADRQDAGMVRDAQQVETAGIEVAEGQAAILDIAAQFGITPRHRTGGMAALATGQAPALRIGAEQRQFLGDADTEDFLIIGKDVLDLVEAGAEDEMREIRLIHRFHVEAMDQFGIADRAEMQAGGAQILQPLLRPVTQPLVRQFARCQQVVVQIRVRCRSRPAAGRRRRCGVPDWSAGRPSCRETSGAEGHPAHLDKASIRHAVRLRCRGRNRHSHPRLRRCRPLSG